MSTNIIARTTPDNRNTVFLLDTLDDKGNIQAWFPDQDEVVASNLNYYKTTKSASDAVESELSGKYVAKFGFGSGINIRRKLFRASKIASLNNGKHAENIVQEAAASPQQPPVGDIKVQLKDGSVIPAQDFVEKIIASLSSALRDTLR